MQEKLEKYIGDIVPAVTWEIMRVHKPMIFYVPDVRKIPDKLTFSCHQKSMRSVDVGTFF